jgi:hypothetical protein
MNIGKGNKFRYREVATMPHNILTIHVSTIAL